MPVLLFVATCGTTFMAGTFLGGHLDVLLWMLANQVLPEAAFLGSMVVAGLSYSVPVMTILATHEAGHFIQARRYGVRCSLPYFIPVPLPPLGTFGAVIGMDSRVRDRKALFDIGISGPLAGLVPTIAFCIWGLSLSKYGAPHPQAMQFGDPLLFKLLAGWVMGPAPAGSEIIAHPIAFAGWVGLLVTSINLLPVGQLDGGHVLYALLRHRARLVASIVLACAAGAVIIGMVVYHYPGWVLMLAMLLLMGPRHPPTRNDYVRLGPVRVLLGWVTLAFIVLGLTPMPILP